MPARVITEIPVRHHVRTRGVFPKYGIDRTFRVILDPIYWFFSCGFRQRPRMPSAAWGCGWQRWRLIPLWLLATEDHGVNRLAAGPSWMAGHAGDGHTQLIETAAWIGELPTRIYYESPQGAPAVPRWLITALSNTSFRRQGHAKTGDRGPVSKGAKAANLSGP